MGDTPCPEDELTLRDLYLILRRHARGILVFTLGLGLLAFAVSLGMPKKYQSTAVLGVTELPKGAQEQSVRFSTAALVEGFKSALETRAFAASLGEERSVTWAKVSYDAKRGYIRLQATGPTPAAARDRARRLVEAAERRFTAAAVAAVRTSLAKEAAQTEGDVRALKEQIRQLEASLNALPPGRASAPSAALQSAGVDPLVAESADPARTYLRLELAKARAELAAKQARQKELAYLLGDEQALSTLAAGSLGVRRVAEPGLPERPVAPRVLLNTALALVLGLFLGIFWAFLRAALEAPEVEPAGGAVQSS